MQNFILMIIFSTLFLTGCMVDPIFYEEILSTENARTINTTITEVNSTQTTVNKQYENSTELLTIDTINDTKTQITINDGVTNSYRCITVSGSQTFVGEC